jgi:N-acetylneuraminic acid mutarotase
LGGPAAFSIERRKAAGSSGHQHWNTKNEIELEGKVMTQSDGIFKRVALAFCSFFLVLFVVTAPAFAQGTWTTKAPMPTVRSVLAGAAVNGIFYAVGGQDSNGNIFSTVEAYDPTTNTWSTKSPLPYPIERAAAAGVNGILYVVGGCADTGCGALLNTVFAYDPTTDMWTQKTSIPTPRRDFAVGVVNGIIYAMGGNQGPGYVCLSSVEAYDPATDSWSEKAPLPIGRVNLSATALNGTLYAIGGATCNAVPNPGFLSESSELDAYVPAANMWTTKAPMLTALGVPGAGAINGVLYVVGGDTALNLNQAYNTATDTWSTAAPMPTGRFYVVAGVVNGTLYAIGGSNSSGQAVGTNEAFTPALTWTLTGSMNTSRVGATGTRLLDGRVLVAGGAYPFGNYLSSAEIYNPATGTWTLTSPMVQPQGGAVAVLLNDGRVLVYGGNTGPSSVTNLAQVFDPTTGLWTATGSMNQCRQSFTGTLLANGQAMAVGGYCGGYLSSVELYNPSTGTWSLTGSLPGPVANASAATLSSGKVLVAGGTTGFSITRAELFDPNSSTWTVTGSLNQARAWTISQPFSGTILLNSGQVLAVGGGNGAGSCGLSSAELYDPIAGTWAFTGSLSTGRDQHRLVLLSDGRVLASGGVASDCSTFPSMAEIYDPSTGAWSATGSLNQARAQHAAASLLDGRVLVAGGYVGSTVLNSAETYGPQTTTSTSTSASSSANPSVFGQSVTLTATVTPTSGSGTPTGNVTFSDGATSLGTSSLSGGQATFTTSSLTLGGHTIAAAYGGDTNFAASSGTVTQTVNQAATGTAISSSPNPAVSGQPVTFTATVSPLPPGSGTPTGTVTFTDGATTLGTAALNGSGQAMLTVPSLSPGSHSIAGQYSGDNNFGSSSSAAGGGGGFTQTVSRASTTTTVNSSVNASILNQLVTFTAHVSVVSPGSGTPTGSVTFLDGSTTLGTVALNASGSATFTTSSLAVNAHSITAAYTGDSNFSGSASATMTQRVQYEPLGTTCDGDAGHQILQPINADGTSVFKLGRPVPAMFRVCDFFGNSVGTPGVVQSFLLTQIISGTVTQTLDDNVDSMTPDTAFRWDPTNLQWIFNMATKNLSTNKTYVYAITLNDGTMIGFQFGLK